MSEKFLECSAKVDNVIGNELIAHFLTKPVKKKIVHTVPNPHFLLQQVPIFWLVLLFLFVGPVKLPENMKYN